ncbi:MAG TPA: ABC transporter ATP-binding protein [Geminicoccus sp.]|jgi:putative ABC transport system ATP-binding protein|uniref:ABC transporter ATP-binding protein n=1 Tax=Geminicoccus sp. TaxID=2024832 RepID=UPI002E3056F5|nr:ABC transporter ATP-binding protein [Geminicoccus sp.]HEX2527574.1 ABC transporter ATP-binding protein [Geminicoccus sp.]
MSPTNSIPVNQLQLRNLRVAFASAGAPVLDIEALDIEAGSQVAVTGPSGSGKTTLAYALTGIQTIDRGEIRWGGVDLAKLSESARDGWRRRHLGLVFQNFHLVPGLTPLANVLAPCYFDALRPSSGQVARAKELLEQMKVPTARPDAAMLSRGEQQRVAIARALLHDPPILVADEPTASLDERSGAQVIELLTDTSRVAGRTLIMITHDVRLVDAASRCILLAAGHLDQGGHSRTSPGHLNELFGF